MESGRRGLSKLHRPPIAAKTTPDTPLLSWFTTGRCPVPTAAQNIAAAATAGSVSARHSCYNDGEGVS